jgi:NAD(P)H-flavin reductase
MCANQAETLIPARLLARTDLSGHNSIIRLELERDLHFAAGQYAWLWLTHHGKTVCRPYSIASSPSRKRMLEFYMSLVARGELTSSFRDPEILAALEQGDPATRLSISGPAGRLVLDPGDRRDLVFVASGTGLAPLMSIVRSLNEAYLAAPESFHARRVFVIHGARRSENLGYREELQQMADETLRNPMRRLGVVYIPTVSRPSEDIAWTGLTGRVETLFDWPLMPASSRTCLEKMMRAMLQAILRPESHLVYVCGHSGTVEAVFSMLGQRGFRPDIDLKCEGAIEAGRSDGQ